MATQKKNATTAVSFDLQSYLDKMSERLEKGQETLSTKVEQGFADVALKAERIATDLTAHEKSDLAMTGETNKRLAALEDTRKTVRWFGSALIVGGIGFFSDLIVNHVPNWLHHLASH